MFRLVLGFFWKKRMFKLFYFCCWGSVVKLIIMLRLEVIILWFENIEVGICFFFIFVWIEFEFLNLKLKFLLNFLNRNKKDMLRNRNDFLEFRFFVYFNSFGKK